MYAKAISDVFIMSSSQKKPVLGPSGPLGGSAFQQMQPDRMDQDSDEEDQ